MGKMKASFEKQELEAAEIRQEIAKVMLPQTDLMDVWEGLVPKLDNKATPVLTTAEKNQAQVYTTCHIMLLDLYQ